MLFLPAVPRVPEKQPTLFFRLASGKTLAKNQGAVASDDESIVVTRHTLPFRDELRGLFKSVAGGSARCGAGAPGRMGGCNVGWPNKANIFPRRFYYAACRGHEAVGRLLLERGADPNGANDPRDCGPPLYYACSDCDNRRACAMATLLLDFGADVDAY